MYKWNSFGLSFNSINPQVKLCQKTYRMYQPAHIQTVMGIASFLISKFTEFLPFENPPFFFAKSHRICSCCSAHAILAISAGSSESSVPSVICSRMSRRPYAIDLSTRSNEKKPYMGMKSKGEYSSLKTMIAKSKTSVHQPYNKLKSVQPPLQTRNRNSWFLGVPKHRCGIAIPSSAFSLKTSSKILHIQHC